MTDKVKVGMDLLEDVLDIYGADRTRWPAEARRALIQLVQASPEAQRRIRDAEAFDLLLDEAPRVSGVRLAALAERIVVQAERLPRLAVSNPAARQNERAPVWRRQSAGMAALAASLMIGIFAGQSQTMAPALSEVAAAAGIEWDGNSQQMAAADEADVAIDEDLL